MQCLRIQLLLFLLQTWQQEAWPFRQHHGILVQLQAMVESGHQTATVHGSHGISSTRQSTAAAAPADKVLLQRSWFIRLRDQQRPPL
jgi:hypothetical protein